MVFLHFGFYSNFYLNTIFSYLQCLPPFSFLLIKPSFGKKPRNRTCNLATCTDWEQTRNPLVCGMMLPPAEPPNQRTISLVFTKYIFFLVFTVTWLLLGHKSKNLILFKSKSCILGSMSSRSINRVKIEDLKRNQVRLLLAASKPHVCGTFQRTLGGNQFSRILGFEWIVVQALAQRCFLKQNKLKSV